MAKASEQEPQKQRALTSEELTQALTWGDQWTTAELALIWKRSMPVGANLEDLQLFLYTCLKKSLNPLLREAYARLQYNRERGAMELIVMSSIQGMLKAADLTGQLNGIKTSFQEDENGNLISASSIIHRKGCDFPFESTVYWTEYNAGTFIWGSKPRTMLAKCAEAAGLRLAFAAALGGMYVEEEFQKSDRSDVVDLPGTSESGPDITDAFAVVEIEPPPVEEATELPAEIVPETETKVDIETAPEPLLFYRQSPGERSKEDKIRQKQANQAILQRLLTDLQIPTGERRKLTNEFCIGYLGEPLPTDPFAFAEPFHVLDQWALHHPSEARHEFLTQPRAFGEKMRSQLLLKETAV